MPKRQISSGRKAYSDWRMATKILERYGGQDASQLTEKHLKTLEWAKGVLCGRDEKAKNPTKGDASAPPTGPKRQRSQEGEGSHAKRPRNGVAPALFSEIAKQAGSTTLGVLDRGREDGTISRENWRRVAAAISSVFLRVVRGNPGPPPRCEDGGWHHGIHKRIVCADERSASLYKSAVSLVGEVWEGAKLEAVEEKDLPARPRARVWLPPEPSAPEEIEEILRYCNPQLPTHNWRVVRFEGSEDSEESHRQALILLNAESLGPLAESRGVITYGFERVVLRVYQSDSRGDGSQPPEVPEAREPAAEEAPMSMEVESVVSGAESAEDALSTEGSVVSIGRFYDRAEEERLLASVNEDVELAWLERTLEDEDPANKPPTF
ncbi:PREDICTED: uncharacterized protein LOC108356399 [Rhagoletis zephyria]|uniref:uncharacterized protein LOC108356399 n=1 Tax=Rhagoletis zephyria TaxID=28612 RepID=UPI0008112CE8|nr:PREDICTED: uncharacterized protein LOC108356399 [Rhagoletis zephyria]